MGRCTATLISPALELSAAHCGDEMTEVVLNATDWKASGETIRIANTVIYNEWESTYDVALLFLEEASSVTPRIIARDCIIKRYLADDADVAIVGYGATDKHAKQVGSVLMEAFTTVTDHDCDDSYLGCNSAVSPGGELIAGGDGIDSCPGDSGGPLYLLTPEGDFLVGVTSRATNIGTTSCGDGGIYVRPAADVRRGAECSEVVCSESSCSGWRPAVVNSAPPSSANPIQHIQWLGIRLDIGELGSRRDGTRISRFRGSSPSGPRMSIGGHAKP